MKALILNSGMGSRMGKYTKEHPKCMTDLTDGDTILSRQLKMLEQEGITDVIITTGYFRDVLIDYCNSLNTSLNFKFVHNDIYDKTNYIYSIYCAKEELVDQDIIMMHGDLVFERSVLHDILAFEKSCMKVSSSLALPEKDFKAVVFDGTVKKVGVEFFDNAMEAQALYKLNKAEWAKWLNKICEFCESDKRTCYAEKALNEITDDCIIYAYDVKDRLCAEIDTPEDWEAVLGKLKSIT
ncbi:MAG: phosphocholine cytidylyltransferase family protein [Ruminococcaceae bacterium]|nr:phosphocholine cytidylyltransferase family protein [Oscillospiraceae bacterium]